MAAKSLCAAMQGLVAERAACAVSLFCGHEAGIRACVAAGELAEGRAIHPRLSQGEGAIWSDVRLCCALMAHRRRVPQLLKVLLDPEQAAQCLRLFSDFVFGVAQPRVRRHLSRRSDAARRGLVGRGAAA